MFDRIWIRLYSVNCKNKETKQGKDKARYNPTGMRCCSDVSFWFHLGWDVVDHIETSSQRRYWYVNKSDIFWTLSRRLTVT